MDKIRNLSLRKTIVLYMIVSLIVTPQGGIISGEHLTQKQLAEKENVDIKKVQLVQKKLKKAKKIKYVGVGKNGHWEWNDN